jgi:hypothetical protein
VLKAGPTRAKIDESVYGSRLQICKGGQLTLADTLWPIVHGTPQNSDSVKGFLKVDKAKRMVVNRADLDVGNLQDQLERIQPVVVVKGPNNIWWTSGLGSVYALEVRGHTSCGRREEKFQVVAEFQRPEGSSTFHGSYSFVDSCGFFYAAFESTVERFHLDKNAQVSREQAEFIHLHSWIDGDKFIAYNLSANGFMILCTFAGNVFVSNTRLHMGAREFTSIEWRSLNLQPAMLQASTLYRDFVKDHGDSRLFVSNSIGMGAHDSASFAFVPTAWGVITVNVDSEDPCAIDFWAIEPFPVTSFSGAWFLQRLGPFGTGSSPTAFHLNGRNYVTVTDGQVDPMNLRVVETSKGFVASAAAISMGVTFGRSKFSTSEQSTSVMVVGREAHLVVVNNYVGIKYFDVEDPNIWSVHEEYLPGILQLGNDFLSSSRGRARISAGKAQKTVPMAVGACSGGVNLYVFDGKGIRLEWSNVDVCSLTGIPLQTENRVWVVGTERPTRKLLGGKSVGPISLFGLDRANGHIIVRAPLPGSQKASKDTVVEEFIRCAIENLPIVKQAVALERYVKNTLNNILYAGVETDGDAIVFGSIAGVNRAIQA